MDVQQTQTLPFANEELIQLILKRLESDKAKFKADYAQSKKDVGTSYLAIDNLLPTELAQSIYEKFPKDESSWREMNSFREKKLTSKAFDKMPKLLGEITFAIQDSRVLKVIEEITGMPQLKPDSMLYAGGLSLMRKTDFLNPHIDNSHDQERKVYRKINLLYYVTPNWNLEDGGHLELWDTAVKKGVTIESKFNRLVLMETHNLSWHSVSPIVKEGFRTCVSNYYFSPVSPLGYDYFHVTSFQGRPEQPFTRLWCQLDNMARMGVRKLFKSGVGKKDVFNAAQGKN